MAGVVAGRPKSIFRLAARLLTIEGRQGENRGQRLQEISKKSPGKNKLGCKPFIPLAGSQPATCRRNPGSAWLRQHSPKPVRFSWKSAMSAGPLQGKPALCADEVMD
jgi:hypothetical protein